MSYVKFLIFFIMLSIFASCRDDSAVASINYKFEGCFGEGSTTIKIINSDNEKIAVVKTSTNRIKRRVFDQDASKAFDLFVKELKALDAGVGCTTVSYYTLKIGDENYYKTDGGCSWKGFDTLYKSLFGD